MPANFIPSDYALAFFRTQPPRGQKPAEVRITATVLRQKNNRRSGSHSHLSSDDRIHSCPFRLYSAKSSGGLPPSNLTSFPCLSKSSWYGAKPTSFLLTSRLAGSSTSHESSPLSFQSKTVP